MANITGHRGKDISTILQSEEGKENGRPPRPSAGQRKKKRRRLNDLDSDSTVDEEESEDEFCLSERYKEPKYTLKFSQQDHFFLNTPTFMLLALWSAARRKSLSSRITNRRQNRMHPTTAAMAAGSIGRVPEGGVRRSNGGAPGSDGDPKATRTTKRKRRMRMKRMK